MNAIRLNTKLIPTLGSILFMSASDMINASNIPTSTWYALMRHPADITIQQLLAISNGLHIPIRRFFLFGRTELIGRRDDYIAEQFLPCSYDSAMLQQIVSTRTDATWKHAAKKTDMTPTRLKNSLLGETRTPVTRFLLVCESFEIDPFTILIDPNKDIPLRKNSRDITSAKHRELYAIRADIAALNTQINDLSATIADLKTKYETLLANNEALANRVRVIGVNIEQIFNDGCINIGAEQKSK